jgi:hypothetical protein
LAKLKFVPVGNVINVEGLASIPSGALFKAKSIWDDIIEMIRVSFGEEDILVKVAKLH